MLNKIMIVPPEKLFHLHIIWNRTFKRFDKSISFRLMLSAEFTTSFHLNRCCQQSLQLHFIWIDIVSRVYNSISFELILSAEFTTPFHLNWCCQQSLQLHFIWIDVVSRVYNSISFGSVLPKESIIQIFWKKNDKPSLEGQTKDIHR